MIHLIWAANREGTCRSDCGHYFAAALDADAIYY